MVLTGMKSAGQLINIIFTLKNKTQMENGFILEVLADTNNLVLSHTSAGQYDTTQVVDEAEFTTSETVANGWKTLINDNVEDESEKVGTRPVHR